MKRSREPTAIDGDEVLARVWQLVSDHRRLKDAGTRSAEAKALRAAQKSIRPADAVAATNSFLARHAAVLQVQRGQAGAHGPVLAAEVERAGEPALPALHPLHTALVEHFGFLDVAVSPEHWPHRMQRDGLRVFGWAPTLPACHLPTQLRIWRAAEAHRREIARPNDDGDAVTKLPLASCLPLLGTLAGVADAWVGDARTLVDRPDFANGEGTSEGSGFSWGAPANPRWGASFAFVARWFLLEQRLERIGRRRALAAACSEVMKVRIDALGRVRDADDARIVIATNEFRHLDRPVTLRRQLVRGPRDRGSSSDPLLERRAEELAARTKLAAVSEEDRDLVAVVELPPERVSPATIRAALAVLAHVERMLHDPSLPDAPDPARRGNSPRRRSCARGGRGARRRYRSSRPAR